MARCLNRQCSPIVVHTEPITPGRGPYPASRSSNTWSTPLDARRTVVTESPSILNPEVLNSRPCLHVARECSLPVDAPAHPSLLLSPHLCLNDRCPYSAMISFLRKGKVCFLCHSRLHSFPLADSECLLSTCSTPSTNERGSHVEPCVAADGDAVSHTLVFHRISVVQPESSITSCFAMPRLASSGDGL